MVAVRIESLNSEIFFSPHRPSISLVERQSSQIAGSEDFIPLESFSVNPLTTKLLFRNPKAEYTRRAYYLAVGRSPKGTSRNTRIIGNILKDYNTERMLIPNNLIPVVDRALKKADSESWKPKTGPRNIVKTGDSIADILRMSGYQGKASSRQVRIIREIGTKYDIKGGKYWNIPKDTSLKILQEYRYLVSLQSERSRKGWETKRVKIAAQEEEKRQKEIEQNRETLTNLYETQYERVVRFIAVRIGNRDEAQELASEVFVRALGAIDSYENRGTPMEAWVFKIARYNLINYINRDKNRRVGNIDDAPPLFSDDNPDDALERDERARSVRRVMKILNPYQRRVLELSFWGDMTIKEVAAALGKTAEQVRAVKTRAIYRLRELMAENRELLSA